MATYDDWKSKVWIVNRMDINKGVAVSDRLVFAGSGDGANPKNILGRIPKWAKDCEHVAVNAGGVVDKVYVTDGTNIYTITRDSANVLTCKTGKDASSGQVVWTAVEGG